MKRSVGGSETSLWVSYRLAIKEKMAGQGGETFLLTNGMKQLIAAFVVR
jgi:hypothetical protein